jgi:hypothetical protein
MTWMDKLDIFPVDNNYVLKQPLLNNGQTGD